MSAFTIDAEGYKQKWFRNNDGITSQVMTGNYDFNLAAGKARKFRLKLKANDSPPDAYCSITRFDDTGIPAQADLARVGLNGSTCT